MSYFGPGFVSSLSGGNDGFTKILLHMDGPNLSTAFTDVNAAGTARTWTPNDAAMTNFFSKFGTTSGIFGLNTSAGYIRTPHTSDLSIGSNDFTVDFWILIFNLSSTYYLAGDGDSFGANFSFYILKGATNAVSLVVADSVGATYVAASGAGAVNNSSWTHVAVQKRGNTIENYIGGTLVASTATSANQLRASPYNFGIGTLGEWTFNQTTCYLQEFRFTNGLARYSGNFTPPTAPYF